MKRERKIKRGFKSNSLKILTGSKYLNGVTYFKKYNFSFNPLTIEIKYDPSIIAMPIDDERA